MGKIGSKNWLLYGIAAALMLFLTQVYLAPAVWAAPTVTASVDRNEMGLHDILTYSVTVSAGHTVQVDEPQLPNLQGSGLSLMQGKEWKEEESSTQWVMAGSGSQRHEKLETVVSQVFNFMMQAHRLGKLTIGPAHVTVNGTSYATNPINVQVMKGGSGQPNPQNNPGNANNPNNFFGFGNPNSLFNQLLQQPGLNFPAPGTMPYNGPALNPNEAFHVIVQVDKKKAYQGEQITASWYLLTTGIIRDLDTLKYPDLRDFWKETIQQVTQLNFTQQVINGVAYKKALLGTDALFPLKPGRAIIDSYKAKATVITGGGAFGAFGFGQPYVYTKASMPIKIKVLPLPTAGRPPDFSGAVGQFQIRAGVKSNTVKANEPFEFKLMIVGRGNAKMIELPALNLPSDIEMYDKKTESRFFSNGTSYKKFTVYLIPRKVGTTTIPSIGLGIFNPQTARYEEVSTKPIQLNVVPGAAAPEGLTTGLMTAVPTPAKTIAPSMPDPIPVWTKSHQWPAGRMWAVWGSLFALASLLLTFKARKELGWGERKRNLVQQVGSRFKKIETLIGQQNWRAVGAETTNSVYYFLGEISDLGGASVELDKLWLRAPPSVKRELEDKIRKQMTYFEMLSFAPDELLQDAKDPVKVRRQVKEMEKLLLRAVQLASAGKSEASTVAAQ